VQISITCPYCATPAEIDDALCGKKLKCAEPSCRQTFRVSPDGVALPVAPKGPPQEADWQSAAPPGADGGADWQTAPPPPRGGGADWRAAPPPVRGAGFGGAPQAMEVEYAEVEAVEAEAVAGEPDAGYDPYGAYRKKSKLPYIVMAVVGLLVAASAGLGYMFVRTTAGQKEKMIDEAKKFMFAGEFGRSIKLWNELKAKYPNPDDVQTFEFYSRWCSINESIRSGDPAQLKTAQTDLRTMSTVNRDKDYYKNIREQVYMASVDLALSAATLAEKNADESLLQSAQEANRLANELSSVVKDPGKYEAKQEETKKKIAEAQAALKADNAAKQFAQEIERVSRQKRPIGIEQLQTGYAKLVAEHPRLAKDNRLQARVEDLKKVEASWITYKQENSNPQRPEKPAPELTLLVGAPIKSVGGEPKPDDGQRVLALARGTLYGLSAHTGDAIWAMRVGVDTQKLPPRLPYRKGQPEIAFVTSVDDQNATRLSAIDLKDGRVLWYRLLSAACPAGPHLVGTLLYVPTVDGRLSVIQADGKLNGYYNFGHALTNLPAWDGTSRKLFVPADSKRVFVVDVTNQKCEDVMYTNHPAGGIRGVPLVAKGTLVLSEAAGMENMTVRVFSTTNRDKDGKALAEFRNLPGHAWFAPFFDGDFLGVVTDKSYLTVFATSSDPTSPPIIKMTDPLPVGLPKGVEPFMVRPVGQAQVAHFGLNEWWLLINGRLLRERFDIYRKQLVPVPGEAPLLGTPLHQSAYSPDGRSLIFVTQLRERVLATCMNRTTGDITWQRQLGLITAQEPVAVGDEVLAQDKTGALFRVKAGSVSNQKAWQSVGDWPSRGLEGGTYSRLVRSRSGNVVASIIFNPLTEQITLRKYEPGKGITNEFVHQLPSPPIGTPAVADDGTVMIPSRDGNLREFSLNRRPSPTDPAPTPLGWRDPSAPSSSIGHAAFIDAKQLIASDGHRKLVRWERDEKQAWRRLPDAAVELTARIGTPPLIVQNGQGETAVVVGDEAGHLHLVTLSGIPSQRQFNMDGPITKGPFLLGTSRIGCVVAGTHFAWLSLTEDGPKRIFTPSEPGIVGQPQAFGNLAIVAEQAGGYSWIDLTQDAKVVNRVAFKGHLTPASGATGLGATWAFAPLSDGTIMLIPVPGAARKTDQGATGAE
jgi:outer membrane protein assembly factor BamB